MSAALDIACEGFCIFQRSKNTRLLIIIIWCLYFFVPWQNNKFLLVAQRDIFAPHHEIAILKKKIYYSGWLSEFVVSYKLSISRRFSKIVILFFESRKKLFACILHVRFWKLVFFQITTIFWIWKENFADEPQILILDIKVSLKLFKSWLN